MENSNIWYIGLYKKYNDYHSIWYIFLNLLSIFSRNVNLWRQVLLVTCPFLDPHQLKDYLRNIYALEKVLKNKYQMAHVQVILIQNNISLCRTIQFMFSVSYSVSVTHWWKINEDSLVRSCPQTVSPNVFKHLSLWGILFV